MMRIKITEANRVAINALLDKINGKSYSHTAYHKHVFDLAQSSELQLEKFEIAKKDRSGSTASGMSGGNVPSAYKYSRIVNTYQIERRSSDWFLIDVKRIDVWGNASKDRLSLTPAQRDIAIAKFTAQFWVQPVVELAVAA
jgi:hypothetical protein